MSAAYQISRWFKFYIYSACTALLVYACTTGAAEHNQLDVITYRKFEEFVSETGYVTDAEKFGWSIIQKDVFTFSRLEGATWKKPDGVNPPPSKDLPVTQVSYNDAIAYCNWSDTKLPTYEQYWMISKDDNRRVVFNSLGPLANADEVSILGNVWEITASLKGDEVRLAGGSLFCSPALCNGTSPERSLYVDKFTGNIHIGFAVISDK